LLHDRSTHDLSLYKASTLTRRVERRMAMHRLATMSEYEGFVRRNPQELDLLFKELLIGVTSFFRDPVVWDALQTTALPQLLAGCPPGSALRAWVAGCSTGEEAYTLAMVFRECLEQIRPAGRHSLQIFATDLDADAISRARQGLYPASIAADVSAERLARFFVEDGNRYRVAKEIREMVVFAPQNLIMDPPFTKLDLLTCRNLLIYFAADLQKKLLTLFHYSLKPSAILMLGGAEAIGGFTELFAPVNGKLRLFRRSSGTAPAVELEFPTRHFPNKAEAAMDASPTPTVANLQTLADRLLLQHFAPAAVLVNAGGDLLYISGRTGRYLEPAAGKVNWNIHAMARDGLRQAIAVALPKAVRSGAAVTMRNLHVGSNGGTQTVDLVVQPIGEPFPLRDMALVVFTDIHTDAGAVPATAGRGARRSQREAALHQQLAQMQQEFRALREEMQSSQEELRSANEELQSTNEELQSTNEELTTSREEMQSLNEELQTVNTELQARVDELSTANSDLKNLLDSTDIATIFLDDAMRVRRFTSQSTRLFKLIPGDVGRPLSDIVTDLVYPALLDDVTGVLRTLVYAEREVATGDGRCYQVRIMPYRTIANVIDGVVITFTDISRAKHLEAELRALAGQTEELP
jgi:two-component system CheB/CheR fusion protein